MVEIQVVYLMAFCVFVPLLFLVIGYYMGRGKNIPDKKETIKMNKNPVEDPDGDLFNDLMQDEPEKRISTLETPL